MDVISQLKSVYATLNAVTISGNQNIDKMYGCFYVLGQVIQELEEQEDIKKKGIQKQGVPVSTAE